MSFLSNKRKRQGKDIEGGLEGDTDVVGCWRESPSDIGESVLGKLQHSLVQGTEECPEKRGKIWSLTTAKTRRKSSAFSGGKFLARKGEESLLSLGFVGEIRGCSRRRCSLSSRRKCLLP